jgi:hypothetical protein
MECVMSAVEFVESLDLAEIDKPGATYLSHLLNLSTYPRAGFVVSGSLQSFVAGVSAQSQRDALNSTLLAQLAANKQDGAAGTGKRRALALPCAKAQLP